MLYSSIANNNILLNNLIYIRWVAISGQLSAVVFVYFFLNISIPLVLCLLAIIISIVVNILSFKFKTGSKYLSDKEALYFLLYDLSQLAFLLYLTGGIYNPFSLLLIAPVIISASFLKIGYSIFLALFSIIFVIFISFFYVEINWLENFFVPNLFTYGLIISLIISIIFIAIYVYILAQSSRKISNALNQTQIALINQKKMSEIGSLTAAAVHEFSTPLNTIFLIVSDLKQDKTLNNKTKSEIEILESQAKKCKEILLNLSKSPQNLKDTFFQKISLSNLIKLNFEKFKQSNINLIINTNNYTDDNEPLIKFSDEIRYSLGNIIQNALEHAKNKINVNISWNKKFLFIEVIDDGKGFTKEIIDKIGDPFISNKKNDKSLGLGIFISKYLIENDGGKINFSNVANGNGSIVKISLIRSN